MSDIIENPYEKMTEEVFQTHLEQMSSIIKTKEIDVKQVFGIADTSISAEDQAKLDSHASLTSEVEKLTKESAAKDLSPEAVQVTQIGVDSIMSQIKGIDSEVDLSSVASKFNNLERISILNDVKPIIEKYVSQIATIKKEIGNEGAKAGTQTFGKPEVKLGDAASIIQSMTKKEE